MRSQKCLYQTMFRIFAITSLFISSANVNAAVVAFEISSRHALADGRSFNGLQYEEVSGVFSFAVNPDDPHNALITDVPLAPRNADGLVSFKAEFQLWMPVNREQGNGVTIIDIPNRGSLPIARMNFPQPGNASGDGYLMNEGYTVIWVGWEHDIPDPSGIGVELPSVPGIQNSVIAGLGYAAVRDVGSWIRYNDAALVHTDTLLSFGVSQSGRFLRNFLYLGFNEDEQGRQVFQGMMPHVAGASQLDLNRRGSTPVDIGQFTATVFPFADSAYADPVSGAVEGLLENPRAAATQPKIFYTNSAVEYWGGGRAAGLTHTLPDGSADIPDPANVRHYTFSSTQHTPTAFPLAAPRVGQMQENPLNYWFFLRALLADLNQWVVDDVAPPPSQVPTLASQALVPLDEWQFPALPGWAALKTLNAGARAANPLLAAEGGAGAPIPMLVPQVDADGNETGGLKHPELSVPLATYTGWNFTNPAVGNPDTLFPLTGGYLPFAASAAVRAATDSRLSVAERYRDKVDFLNRVDVEARKLVLARYLRAEDVNAIVQNASSHWDLLMSR